MVFADNYKQFLFFFTLLFLTENIGAQKKMPEFNQHRINREMIKKLATGSIKLILGINTIINSYEPFDSDFDFDFIDLLDELTDSTLVFNSRMLGGFCLGACACASGINDFIELHKNFIEKK